MRRHPVHSVTRRLLVAGALLSGVFLAIAPGVVTQTEPSSNDRGGPVVVGGLPCIVEPSLYDMFWLPLGQSSGGLVQGMPPMAAVIGPPSLDGVLQDAWGTPYGWVETDPDYRVLGLSNVGAALLDRVACMNGGAVLWQWVPEGYVGGQVVIHTALGKRTEGVAASSFPLPLAEVAAQPGTSLGTVYIDPNDSNPQLGRLTVKLTATGGTVKVEFLP